MATADYTHGEMDISEQSKTWTGFLKASTWGGAIIMMIVAYATFTLTMGMPWLIALVLVAGSAIVGGLAMNMGGAWVASVIGLSALAVVVQIIIGITGWFL